MRHALSGSHGNHGMNHKDLAIGVLSVTAVILFSAFIITQHFAPQQAMAYGQNERAGDFLISTAQLDDTAELLIVVEAALQRMNVYGFNVPAGQIELIQQVDLAAIQRALQPRQEAPRR